ELVSTKSQFRHVDDLEISADNAWILFRGQDVENNNYQVYARPFNIEPVINTEPILTATVGQAYSYGITTSDANFSDFVSLNLVDGPNWLNLVNSSDGTALLAGVPTDPGNYSVLIEAFDLDGFRTPQAFTLVVQPASIPGTPPLITTEPITSVVKGQTYYYPIDTLDSDPSDEITYSSVSLPGWLKLIDLKDGSAILTASPADAEVGTYAIVLVAQNQAGNQTVQSFELEVQAGSDFLPHLSRQLTPFLPEIGLSQAEDFIFTPDGKHVLQHRSDGKVVSYRLDDLDAEPVILPSFDFDETRYDRVKFSPDSQYVLHRSQDPNSTLNRLYRIPVSGGEAVEISEPNNTVDSSNEFVITNDGEHVVYQTWRNNITTTISSIYKVPLLGGNQQKLYTFGEGGILDLVVTPDGSRAVFFQRMYTRPEKGYF
ncbi:MAG: putative Ig domain-containing protein, partial [Chloroflexota bacterium]